MSDRRLTPANGRVALRHLKGQVEASSFVDGEWFQVGGKMTNLWADESCKSLDRQLIYGERFLVLETRLGLAFGQAERDGYVGYVCAVDLVDASVASHGVCVRATHLYPEANLKTVPVMSLSFGSLLNVVRENGDFLETDTGVFIFKPHVRELSVPVHDAAGFAEMFVGTPYLWGGNSCDGIDCSGLVQAALLNSGVACPGDSDLQQNSVGEPIGGNVAAERGDLMFWKGHVAMALDSDRLVHATAHSMSVVVEEIQTVVDRINAQGGGAVLARKRP